MFFSPSEVPIFYGSQRDAYDDGQYDAVIWNGTGPRPTCPFSDEDPLRLDWEHGFQRKCAELGLN